MISYSSLLGVWVIALKLADGSWAISSSFLRVLFSNEAYGCWAIVLRFT